MCSEEYLDPLYWRETYPVRTWDLGADGSFSICSLGAMLFDAAGTHAHQMGLAVADLMGENYTWMLSRFSVILDHQPRWRDTITIITWPSGIDKLSALRDFEITGSDRTVLGRASSSWLVIDRTNRRPVRVEPFLEKISPDLIFPAGAVSLPKVPDIGQPARECRFPVRWSDIDFNGHVTSARYIGWALDGISPEFRKSHAVYGLDINYRAETFFGETVISLTGADKTGDGAILHRIACEQDGRERPYGQGGPEAEAEVVIQQGITVCTDGIECHVAQVEEARKTDDDVQAETQHHIDQGSRHDVRLVAGEEKGEGDGEQ